MYAIFLVVHWHPFTHAPMQVIVVEDENGNIVRETMKDNDVLAQYKTMRETLVRAWALETVTPCMGP